MTLRSVTPIVFTVLCLALSGLVLRRQMAAHPRPPEERIAEEHRSEMPRWRGYRQSQLPPELIGLPVDKRTWHIAREETRAAVVHCIQGQLDAFRAGDSVAAMSFMRHRKDRHFPPQMFEDRIQEMAPEFGHARMAEYGPVWTDKGGRHADVFVNVVGENGRLAQGTYKLIRQDGVYRVAGLEGGGWMGENAFR